MRRIWSWCLLRSIVILALLLLAEAADAQPGRASEDGGGRGSDSRADGTLALPKALGALPPQSCGSGGLMEFLTSGVFDGAGVSAQKLSSSLDGVEGVQLVEGFSFRWVKGIAVRLVLHVPEDLAAWRLGRVELGPESGPRQSVRAIEALLASPGQRVLLVMKEAGSEELRGGFVLYLHEASGGLTLMLRGVSFP